MNRWRRSVGELQARRRQVSECEQALAALSKVTGCFQQMASSLGSNTDGGGLREELAEIRAIAHRIYTGKPYRATALQTWFNMQGGKKVNVGHLHTLSRQADALTEMHTTCSLIFWDLC